MQLLDIALFDVDPERRYVFVVCGHDRDATGDLGQFLS